MKQPNLSKWPTDKLSKIIFYSLIALTVVIFALFFLIGYNHPYEENPNFNNPLFTNLLIGFLLIVVVATIIVSVCSVIRNFRRNKGITPADNGIPAIKIAIAASGLTLLTLITTLILGSSESTIKNGEDAGTPFWNRTADMFVNTSLFLIIAAILIICVSYAISKKRNHQ